MTPATAARVILVGGMPRSGTSLMRAILAAHPDVAMFPGELPVWRALAAAHPADLSSPGARERLIGDLLAHPSMKRARVTLDAGELGAVLAAEPAATLGAALAHALAQYARRSGKPRGGVKEPRCEFHAERIFRELPAAGMIHMLRDPRDVVASQRAMWGPRAQHIVSTVHDWRRSATIAQRERARRRSAYLAVRYEDLVTEPERIVDDVCRALDLTYRPGMLDIAGQPLWPGTEADPPEPARPISADRLGRHRGTLAAGEALYLERRARREMEIWGYASRTPVAARDWPGVARCVAQEGAWRLLRGLRVWPRLARTLGRQPPGR